MGLILAGISGPKLPIPSPPSYVLLSPFAWLPRHPFMQWLPRRQGLSVAENDFMLVF